MVHNHWVVQGVQRKRSLRKKNPRRKKRSDIVQCLTPNNRDQNKQKQRDNKLVGRHHMLERVNDFEKFVDVSFEKAHLARTLKGFFSKGLTHVFVLF